jgi:hypothetical protein
LKQAALQAGNLETFLRRRVGIEVAGPVNWFLLCPPKPVESAKYGLFAVAVLPKQELVGDALLILQWRGAEEPTTCASTSPP